MIQEYTLEGGARLLVEPTEWLQGVTAGVYVAAGSADEPEDLSGIAHVLEHVVFKGTEHYSGKEIGAAIEAYGGELNAYTTKEYTCLWGRALPEGLEKLLELLSELFLRPTLRRRDLETERRVIAEEHAAWQDNPEDQVLDMLETLVFRGDPLERRVLGSASSLRGMRAEDVRYFHAQHWRLENTVLAVSGPVQPEAVRLAAERLFAAASPLAQARRLIQDASEGRTRPPMRLGQVHVAIGGAARAVGDPMLAAQEVLMEELGGGPNSRLFQRLREQEAVSYGVYAFQTAYRRRGMWAVYADLSIERWRDGIRAILEEIREMTRARYSSPHLERLRSSVRGQFLLSLDAPFARLERAAVSRLLLGHVEPPEEAARRISEVQPRMLHLLARQFFSSDSFRVALIDDSGAVVTGGLNVLPEVATAAWEVGG